MTILAAVDGRPHSTRVVNTGYDLARQYDTKLRVFHVMEREKADRRIEEEREYYLDDAVTDARTTAENAVGGVVDEAVDVEVSGHVGKPAEIIHDEVETHDPNYLVIGGRERTPVGKAILGSVLQSVLRSASVPVVTVMDRE
ncbi:universal stress protein [Halobellus sp. GM3]|uniref:universal stress protein n=1 Tax=Halobellus sp. GM3 TaxID=3458410 RepID=UPI00403DCE5F